MLGEILQLEYRAIRGAARGHPAVRALEEAVKHSPSKGIIILVSLTGYDMEALRLSLEGLKKVGYDFIALEARAK